MISQKDRKWRLVTDNPIVLDFSGCRYADEIHAAIKDAFGFPDYYGANWDALWDCLRDFALSESQQRFVHVKGIAGLPKDLRAYAQEALEIMRELEEKYPIMHFSFIDESH